MVAWAGAPSDYDRSKPIAMRDGDTLTEYQNGGPFAWDHTGDGADIIAYTPRTPAGEGSGVGGCEAIEGVIRDALSKEARQSVSRTQIIIDARDAILAHIVATAAAAVQAEREVIEAEARRCAVFHAEGSDKRDAFLTFADFVQRLARSDASEGGGETLDGWQDISTAPMDETFRLLFEPHDMGGFIFVGCYDQTKGEWFNNLDFKSQVPTHWRPLPAPPGSAQVQP
jgi:hypothetical protein